MYLPPLNHGGVFLFCLNLLFQNNQEMNPMNLEDLSSKLMTLKYLKK